jgi:hypothetical protein
MTTFAIVLGLVVFIGLWLAVATWAEDAIEEVKRDER